MEKNLSLTGENSSSNENPLFFNIFLKYSQGIDLNLSFFFHGCLSGFSLRYLILATEIFPLVVSFSCFPLQEDFILFMVFSLRGFNLHKF